MLTTTRRTVCAAVVLVLAAGPSPAQPTGDVPYVPTPEPVVQSMLELAQVGPGDFVLDLGSGDGRIVIAAARDFGARGLGVDLNPVRIREARANARQAKVEDRVRFAQGDLFEMDLSRATVLTMYLLPEVNLRLRPKILEQLAPGSRVVSHDFDMGEWAPDREIKVPGEGSNVYLWVVPARVEGAWRLNAGDGGEPWRLDVRQEFQRLDATARRGGDTVDLRAASVRGNEIAFTWPDGRRFLGAVDGDSREMRGVAQAANLAEAPDWQAVRIGS